MLLLNSSTIDECEESACKNGGVIHYKLCMEGDHDSSVREYYQAQSHGDFFKFFSFSAEKGNIYYLPKGRDGL